MKPASRRADLGGSEATTSSSRASIRGISTQAAFGTSSSYAWPSQRRTAPHFLPLLISMTITILLTSGRFVWVASRVTAKVRKG